MSTKKHFEALTGRKAPARRTKQVVGYVGVDAGMIYIGDPCYVIGKELGKDYEKFLTYLPERPVQAWTIPFDRYRVHVTEAGAQSAPMRAVVVGSGFGDGLYPVEAEIDTDGRVRKVTINFDK